MNVRQDLFGTASGSGFGGHYCPEGVPVELGLLSILAAFGVAFGVLYIALTLTTAGRRKKRSEEDEEDLTCRADDVEQAMGCKVALLTAANPRIGKIVDLVWHGESISTNYQLGRGAENQNGNLRWHLPLGVRPPPPLMAQISRHFFTPLFSFAIESYIYEMDFTLQKYHF